MSKPSRGMIAGQKIDTDKKELSKRLRRDSTKAEKVLWNQLRKNQLEGIHFRRQQVIDGIIADFNCHQHGLVIEVDGGVHDTQKEYDGARDIFLSERKLKVIRFTNEKVVSDLESVMGEILNACRKPMS